MHTVHTCNKRIQLAISKFRLAPNAWHGMKWFDQATNVRRRQNKLNENTPIIFRKWVMIWVFLFSHLYILSLSLSLALFVYRMFQSSFDCHEINLVQSTVFSVLFSTLSRWIIVKSFRTLVGHWVYVHRVDVCVCVWLFMDEWCVWLPWSYDAHHIEHSSNMFFFLVLEFDSTLPLRSLLVMMLLILMLVLLLPYNLDHSVQCSLFSFRFLFRSSVDSRAFECACILYNIDVCL